VPIGAKQILGGLADPVAEIVSDVPEIIDAADGGQDRQYLTFGRIIRQSEDGIKHKNKSDTDPVGAGLPAKAVYQSTSLLNDEPQSPASRLLQAIAAC
jgi:hypothetical protein